MGETTNFGGFGRWIAATLSAVSPTDELASDSHIIPYRKCNMQLLRSNANAKMQLLRLSITRSHRNIAI